MKKFSLLIILALGYVGCGQCYLQLDHSDDPEDIMYYLVKSMFDYDDFYYRVKKMFENYKET